MEGEREVLPPPKATECALMRCGREHTVSPESEREQTHTHQRFRFTATLLFKMSEHACTCTHTHTLVYMPIHTYTPIHGGLAEAIHQSWPEQGWSTGSTLDQKWPAALIWEPAKSPAKTFWHGRKIQSAFPSLAFTVSWSAARVVAQEQSVGSCWFCASVRRHGSVRAANGSRQRTRWRSRQSQAFSCHNVSVRVNGTLIVLRASTSSDFYHTSCHIPLTSVHALLMLATMWHSWTRQMDEICGLQS